MARVGLSKPVSLAVQLGIVRSETTFFDYGCGRGGDVKRLAAEGIAASGWDPAFAPDTPKVKADVVNLGYVVNVIEDPLERAETLRSAWQLAKQVLMVAARPDWEAGSVQGRAFGDGVLTANGTFQRFYAQHELRDYIEAVLDTPAVAAAPGVFYVFRDQALAHGFMASRVRNRPTIARQPRYRESLYEAHRALLEPLLEFALTRGRPPEASEISSGAALVAALGSIKAAVSLVRRVFGDEIWAAARERATQDLSVILALQAFSRRPKFEHLPRDLQLDIKALFGSYAAAREHADRLLFQAGDQQSLNRACAQSALGKLTPEALYVHVSALNDLSPLLRVYEGCAKVLTGSVDGATIIKLNRLEPKVSFLSYPAFDESAHPALSSSLQADLRRLDVKFRDYRAAENPPVLHRKETFVAEAYPSRPKFAQLTRQEERAGLLEEAHSIGTRNAWEARLADRGLRVVGHRLLKARPQPT
jgi:DNA phosphorothioation-associated putative methyltransferase